MSNEKDSKKIKQGIHIVDRSGGALDKALTAARSVGDSVHMGHSTLAGLETASHVLPPLRLFLVGVATVFTFAHTYLSARRRLQEEPDSAATKRYLGFRITTLTLSLALIGIAVASLIVTALAPIFLVVALGVGVVKEAISLSKNVINHREQVKQFGQLQVDHQHIAPHKVEEINQIRESMRELDSKISGRTWKFAHRGINLVTGVLSIAAVVVAVLAGPPGWIALAAVAVVSMVVSIGLMIAKKIYTQREQAADLENAVLKPHGSAIQESDDDDTESSAERESDSEEKQMHLRSTLDVEEAILKSEHQDIHDQAVKAKLAKQVQDLHARPKTTMLADDEKAASREGDEDVLSQKPVGNVSRSRSPEQQKNRVKSVPTELDDEEDEGDSGQTPQLKE